MLLLSSMLLVGSMFVGLGAVVRGSTNLRCGDRMCVSK